MSRLLELAKNIALSNLSELKYPYRLTYILTYRCRFKCGMCNIWEKTAGEELSLEQIEKFFDASNRFSWINLSGGEIFLRKDLPEVLDVILTKCKRLYLLDFPTNGYETGLITDAVRKIMTKYRLPKLLVTVSLDGPKELHDRIRGVQGSWDRAVQTFAELRKLRSSRFKVFFGMTLQPLNMDHFEETLDSADRLIGRVAHDDFHINIAHYSPHYYGNTDAFKNSDSAALWNRMDEISAYRKGSPFDPVVFLEKRYQRLSKIYLANNKSPVPCQALSASFFMDPAGVVYPCSIYDKSAGNIKDFDYDIQKLWSCDLRKKIRKEIRSGLCPHCWTPCEAYQSILANLIPKLKGA